MKKSLAAALAAPAALAALTLLPTPALAHTTITIAAFHDVWGGEVGPVSLSSHPDGQATDGHVTFQNLDPVTHVVKIDGPVSRTITLTPGESEGDLGLTAGSYSYVVEDTPTIAGKFRVT